MENNTLTTSEKTAILNEIEAKTRQLISIITGLIALGLTDENEIGLIGATGMDPSDIFIPFGITASDIQKDIEALTAKLFKTIN